MFTLTRLSFSTLLLLTWPPLTLVGCALQESDFERGGHKGTLIVPEVTPPPAELAGQEDLYQLLFADEFGQQARPLGQRARMLAWLRRLQLTPAQLEQLLALTTTIQQAEAQDRAALQALGEREAFLYTPVYEDIVKVLAVGADPSQDTWEQLADRLQTAHQDLDQGQSLRRQRYQATRQLMGMVHPWVASLNVIQARRLSECRYFLRRRLDPIGRPGDYERSITTLWDATDFYTLEDAARDEDPGGMDLGGLWSAEALRFQAEKETNRSQLNALLLMALLEPGLDQAVQVLLGTREPLDFSEREAPPAALP